MNIPFDECNYYAASVYPLGNSWRTSHTSKEHAIKAAQRFVSQWAEHNVEASARVYYRDGSAVADFSSAIHQERNCEPTATAYEAAKIDWNQVTLDEPDATPNPIDE